MSHHLLVYFNGQKTFRRWESALSPIEELFARDMFDGMKWRLGRKITLSGFERSPTISGRGKLKLSIRQQWNSKEFFQMSNELIWRFKMKKMSNIEWDHFHPRTNIGGSKKR
jgi:hypothetical protein